MCPVVIRKWLFRRYISSGNPEILIYPHSIHKWRFCNRHWRFTTPPSENSNLTSGNPKMAILYPEIQKTAQLYGDRIQSAILIRRRKTVRVCLRYRWDSNQGRTSFSERLRSFIIHGRNIIYDADIFRFREHKKKNSRNGEQTLTKF